MDLLLIVDWDELMGVDRVPRDVSLDVDGDAIIMDYSARKQTFALSLARL